MERACEAEETEEISKSYGFAIRSPICKPRDEASQNSVARRFDKAPMTLGSWSTVRESKTEKVKVFPPSKVSVKEVLIVRAILFIRRGLGRDGIGKFTARREH